MNILFLLAQVSNALPEGDPLEGVNDIVVKIGSNFGPLDGVIAVAVPLLVSYSKRWLSCLPKVSLPFIAIGLGAGLQALSAWAGMEDLDGLKGVLLGASGVVLRELTDQTKKLAQPVTPDAKTNP